MTLLAVLSAAVAAAGAVLLAWPAPSHRVGRILLPGTGSGAVRDDPGRAVSGRRLREWRADPQAPAEVPAAVLADLVAALLAAGHPADLALATVRRHLAATGAAEPAGLAPVAEALQLAVRTGLAPGSLVRAEAAEQRRRETALRIQAARRLGVLVVLPVGLCLLPAFVAVTVLPLVLGLLG